MKFWEESGDEVMERMESVNSTSGVMFGTVTPVTPLTPVASTRDIWLLAEKAVQPRL